MTSRPSGVGWILPSKTSLIVMNSSENQAEGLVRPVMVKSRSLPRRRTGKIFDSQDFTSYCSRVVEEEERPEEQENDVNNQSTHDQPAAANSNSNSTTTASSKSPTKSNDYRRMMATHEICQSEVEYVKHLVNLRDHFILPMEEEQGCVLQDAQAAVFCNNLKQIVMLNSKLRDDLMTIVNLDGFQQRVVVSLTEAQPQTQQAPRKSIGAIFCRYAPLFKLYASYAKDFDDVTKLFRDSRIEAFLESCIANTKDIHTFESYLIRPIQRVPRYKLLLSVSYDDDD